MHAEATWTVQVPSVAQHAPKGHVTVAHVVPAPRKVPPAAVHVAPSIDEHVRFGRQHAPGCGHVVVAQVVPPPWKMPPCVVQALVKSVLHVPFWRQQAPCTSGTSESVAPLEMLAVLKLYSAPFVPSTWKPIVALIPLS